MSFAKGGDNTDWQLIDELTRRIENNPADDTLYVERGRIYWRLGKRGDAMTDYQRAAELNPEGPGRLLAEHSNSIMAFFNPDLLNP